MANYLKPFFSVLLSIVLVLSTLMTGISSLVSAEQNDAIEYSGVHSFELDGTNNYIRNIQTNTYATESNVSISVSQEQADHGSKSLKVQMLEGAAKGQYINLELANFNPAAGKWYNLKVFVPADSSANKIALTYTNTSGTIKRTGMYYFDDNGNTSLVTDEIREKGKWVTLSLQLANSVSLRCVGIYAESFSDSNAGAVFYVDSYSVTDKALDDIRFPDLDDPAVRYSFETGEQADFIRNIQNNDYNDENNISVSITREKADQGKRSMKIEMLDGAAKGQYINLLLEYFKPDAGKWYNLKVFVPEDSSTDKLSLTYTNTSGIIKRSDTYYFDDNGNTSLKTDEIREKGKWITLSLQIPDPVSLRCVGIYAESFSDSNAGAVFYVDSYSVTDKPLDDIRFFDLLGGYSFETGTIDTYISQVQKNNSPNFNWEDAGKYSKAISSEQASSGSYSLKITMKSGSHKGHLIFFTSKHFRPASDKWYNIKVFVPVGSSTDKIQLFYRNQGGSVVKGNIYYFSNSAESPVDTEKILDKGVWVNLSIKIPSDVKVRDVGIFTESFNDTESGSIFYLDEYSVTDSALSIDQYTVSGEKTLDASYSATTLTNFKDVSKVSSNGGAVTQIVADGQDERSIKITASSSAYVKFVEDIGFTSGDWINLRVKSENLGKIQVFYDTGSGNIMADELSVGTDWSVVSFARPNYAYNKTGLLLSKGNLFIDGIYSSSEPFDLENQDSNIKCGSTYFGFDSDYLLIDDEDTLQEDNLQFLKSKFTSNLSAANISVYRAATGKIARFKISGCTIKEYKIVVRGDINGNSAVDSDDIALLRESLIGLHSLADEYLAAADFDASDSVDVFDFIRVKKLLMGACEKPQETLTVSNDISVRTEALREYLSEIYGNYTLAGQQFLTSKYPEITCIYGTTGKLPSLMGFDIQGSDRSSKISPKVKEAIKWYKECNGVVTLMWHWSVPRDINDLSKGYSLYKYVPGVRSDGTTFSVVNATTPGTAEYEYVMGCIDNIAIQLKELQDQGVPVLWRPLHEAAGNKLTASSSAWYWYGADGASSYKTLWNIIYDRLENYHGLKNLIWVWNGQGITWIPDKSTFDIASYDTYGNDSDADVAYEQLSGAVSDKMLALSEAGHIPTVSNDAKWLYWVGWYTEYTYKPLNGRLVINEEWNSEETIINDYHSEKVITLDELPKLAYTNKNGVPEPIEYYNENGHIKGGDPQWENGEITLEAELANVTNCKYYGSEDCSGFAYVLWLGKEDKSDLIFTVDVPQGKAGEYIAEIYYAGVSSLVDSVDKWHNFTYNGQNTGLKKFATSNEKFTSVRINITLNSGINTLGFYWNTAPSSAAYVVIDCIKLIKK